MTYGPLFTIFDVGATLLWAISGAMMGARRGYDLIGIFIVATASSTSGGLLRDGLFLQGGPPNLVRNPIYLQMITLATVLIFLFGRQIRNFRWINPTLNVIDALGIGTFAVVGMTKASSAGLPPIGVLAVGMVNGCCGSMLRDILVGEAPPRLLRPGVHLASAALVGCVLYMIAVTFVGVSQNVAAPIIIGLVFILRMAAVRFDLQSRPLSAFEEDWGAKREGERAP